MPTPANLMPRIEGLISSGLRAARAPQRVITWKDCMRTIMFSSGLRDATDWDIATVSDVVNLAASLDASGGTVYGVLIDHIYDVANEDLCVLLANTTGQTLTAETVSDLGGAVFGADSAGSILLESLPAADTSNAVFMTYLNPSGSVFATQIEVMADGEEGTAPTALDVRCYIVYRTDTEAQV